MKEKFLNDCIIGNNNIKASYSEKGELLRLFYPTVDYKQFLESFTTGVKINDSNLIKLHDDINNIYNQYYTENTNILKTQIKNTYFNLKIIQTDFVPIKEDVLIKRYSFINENTVDLDVEFLIDSALLSNHNNMISCKIENDTMIQYSHDYTISIFSKEKIDGYQIHECKESMASGILLDKDYIGMSNKSAICYSLGTIKPGEIKKIEIFININDNNTVPENIDAKNQVEQTRKMDINKLENDTKKYWNTYVEKHKKLDISKIENNEKINEIYTRTILLYPLLSNIKTGGISAGIEIDENLEKSGRYSYCWTRDAVFVTKALDILKMEKETEKFYKNFCKITQSKSGMWEQRFYTDGHLAPCWGYQIDETASVVYGIYEHYLKTKDKKFLKETLKMCEKAVEFLEKYIKDILSNKNEMQVSYDLWEMNEGIHLYSLSSIFAGFNSMIKIYKEVEEYYKENRLKIQNILEQTQKLEQYQIKIKEYVMKNLFEENTKILKRNTKDSKTDISQIASVMPFNMFSAKEKHITNLIEKINLTLRTYTGGYIRFEEDNYLGGNNPWPIATLWMSLYYLEINETKKAMECFNFVTKTATKQGYLSEQIDNKTLKPNWVIGLGWSHAMYIIVLEKLIG